MNRFIAGIKLQHLLRLKNMFICFYNLTLTLKFISVNLMSTVIVLRNGHLRDNLSHDEGRAENPPKLDAGHCKRL